MFVAAWGCFNVRYWAVLGMQALLGLSIVLFSLLLIGAENILVAADLPRDDRGSPARCSGSS